MVNFKDVIKDLIGKINVKIILFILNIGFSLLWG